MPVIKNIIFFIAKKIISIKFDMYLYLLIYKFIIYFKCIILLNIQSVSERSGQNLTCKKVYYAKQLLYRKHELQLNLTNSIHDYSVKAQDGFLFINKKKIMIF